jgi:hypothetical protein
MWSGLHKHLMAIINSFALRHKHIFRTGRAAHRFGSATRRNVGHGGKTFLAVVS